MKAENINLIPTCPCDSCFRQAECQALGLEFQCSAWMEWDQKIFLVRPIKSIRIDKFGRRTVSYFYGTIGKTGWRTNAFLSGKVLSLPATMEELRADVRMRQGLAHRPLRVKTRAMKGVMYTEFQTNRHQRKRGWNLVENIFKRMEEEGLKAPPPPFS